MGRADAVRVFEADSDLLAGVDEPHASVLRRRVVAPRLHVDPGPWEPPAACREGFVGLIVLDGLLLRTVVLRGRPCPELLGPGDLLRPWDEPASSIEHERGFVALERTSVAVLDGSFAAVAGRFPSIFDVLLRRTSERARSLALTLAIVHMRRAEDRLTACLWHLADRWGRVTPEGVHLPLRLTQELLAQLTCVRRPTASTSLSRLCEKGEIARRPDGTWLLRGLPPSGTSDDREAALEPAV